MLRSINTTLRRRLAHLRQHRRIARAHLQQQLIGRAPQLAFAHDLQKQRIALAGVVLDAFGRRVGAAAGDHHRFIGVEQKRRGDVLPGQGREGHRIHPQILKQVVGQGRGGIEIAVLGIDDQRQIPRHQIPHLQQQLKAKRPQGLVEAKAGFDRAHMGAGGLHHRLDPVARLAQKRAVAHAVAQGPALQHLRVRVKTRHQERLALGDGFSELNEEAHPPDCGKVVDKRSPARRGGCGHSS